MQNAAKCTEKPVNLLHILKINHLQSNSLHLLGTGFKTEVLPLGDNLPCYELFADRARPPLEGVHNIKLLGLTIDSSLSFKAHIKSVCNKVNVKVSALRRVRKFIPSEVMVNIYNVNFCKDHRNKIEVPDPLAVEDLISSKLNNKRKLARLITQYRDIFFPIFRKARPSFFRLLQRMTKVFNVTS